MGQCDSMGMISEGGGGMRRGEREGMFWSIRKRVMGDVFEYGWFFF